MPPRLRLPALPPERRAELRARFEQAPDPETRTRFQIAWLAAAERRSPAAIAPLVLRSHDTVQRVLQRFVEGGLDAVPRRTSPGAPVRLSQPAEAELARVIEEDPRRLGVDAANWTTGLLATRPSQELGISVNPETVRRALHRLGYVCKRPIWTVAHQAQEREGWAGNASGERSSRPRPRRPRRLDPSPPPSSSRRPPSTGIPWSSPTCGSWSRPISPSCSPSCRAPTATSRMRSPSACTRP
jgi:transposase